ncbi:MAG: M14 family zinc carboxypeptidase [Ilumatobacteraceae bacterium]
MRALTFALAGSIMFATTTGAVGVSAESSSVVPAAIESTRIIGTSVQGRPIEAIRRGTPGGTVVLVIGVIHGDEVAGLTIVDHLKTLPVPEGIDLWLVPSMNPDGVANGTHTNANMVDLNRNFPYQWRRIFQLGNEQYSGPTRASEPETKAMIAFMREIKPELGIWYHQDLHRISPGTGINGQLRARYSQQTGIPLKSITGGTYWGIAATWQRAIIPDSYSFVVELGPTPVRPKHLLRNAHAVLDVALLRRALSGK